MVCIHLHRQQPLISSSLLVPHHETCCLLCIFFVFDYPQFFELFIIRLMLYLVSPLGPCLIQKW